MAAVLYDLAGKDDRRFSPYCWRARLALAHCNVPFETRPVRFTEIPDLWRGEHKTVPVLDDGGTVTCDSLAIAVRLHATYPAGESLFPGGAGPAFAHFLHQWTFRHLHPRLVALIIGDLMESIDPVDRDYFRRSREARYGRRLEEIQVTPEAGLPAVHAVLEPVRAALQATPYLSGDQPAYPDYIVFGSLQWARLCSDLTLLADDDPVRAWFDRLLDRHEGAAANA